MLGHLRRISRVDRARSFAERGLRALAGFAKSLKIKYQDIEVGIDLEPEPGLADNGDLEHDLQTLLSVIGTATKSAGNALVLFIDELQYVHEDELAALITSLHRVAQLELPILLVGAGLPQLRGKMGKAKSYAERLFDFPTVGPLASDAARSAIEGPIVSQGVAIDADALDLLFERTRGYPYFVQEWGKHVWEVATKSPIMASDVRDATTVAVAALDESFFRVRFDRLTLSEKKYLRAMAELGEGPLRSGDIANLLNRKVQSLGPTRNNLISKGMIWSPTHGDTEFTVPMFDDFMKRIMPGNNWQE